MKVAIDISARNSSHTLRGIGVYTKNLVNALKKRSWGIDLEFFDKFTSSPNADLIHYPYFDFFFHTLPTKPQVKRVITIHDAIPLVFPEHFPVGIKGKFNFFLQKLALKKIDAVLCDSNTSKKDIAEKLFYPEEKIHVVYLAANSMFKKNSSASILAFICKKYKLPGNFVLYVGDVNWHKNIHNLLKAVSLAQVNLVMVGQALVNKGLSQTQEIENLVSELNLEKKVIRTGYVEDEDLVSIYNLAQITLLPSYYEGFGLSLIESMACGTPVICSEVASLSEIGKNVAFFCDPHDPGNIAQKIKHVLNISKKEKEDISQKCIKHAASFTWQKTARDTVEVYKKVLKS